VSLAVLAGFFICVVGAYIARAWVLHL
jgi:hypothetical protein